MTSFASLRTRLLRSFSVTSHLLCDATWRRLQPAALALAAVAELLPFAHYGELFKTSEPVVRAVFGLSVFPSVRENERRKQGSKVYGQKDDGVRAV
jgi:hypothetical protein